LLIATIIALVWANSEYAAFYEEIFLAELGLHFDEFRISLTVEEWISDGLMALFFYFLGLEIKRELIAGELRDWRRSVPVIMAAAGGMIFPALFYAGWNVGSGSPQGWGIPMATDTAFAIGVLALLRHHVPAGLTLFVTALAIIDDIGAMLVMVYSGSIATDHLLIALVATGLLLALNGLGVRRAWPYLICGVWIWLELHEAGIHTTIAGVLVAMTVPARSEVSPTSFLNNVTRLLGKYAYLKNVKRNHDVLSDSEQHEVVSRVADSAQQATTPLRRWEDRFEKPINLLVMPLFALANAGIAVAPDFFAQLVTSRASIGIFFGLVFGKSIGIVGMSWIALKMGWGRLPTGLHLGHVVGIGLLAGIGFTMSILVATLAFSGEPEALALSKSAILSSSLVAGVLGYTWLRFGTKRVGAETEDSDEQSGAPEGQTDERESGGDDNAQATTQSPEPPSR